MPLMKSVTAPLAESALLSLGLSEGMSVADAAIQKKVYGSDTLDLASRTTALIMLNEEIEDIMKIVKSHEESGL